MQILQYPLNSPQHDALARGKAEEVLLVDLHEVCVLNVHNTREGHLKVRARENLLLGQLHARVRMHACSCEHAYMQVGNTNMHAQASAQSHTYPIFIFYVSELIGGAASLILRGSHCWGTHLV